jgi:hypothetical protein
MSQPFEKGSLIVLMLVVLLGGVFAYDTIKDIQVTDEIVAETDARTEYLRDQYKDLDARVKALEGKAAVTTPAPAP